ncbi:hypothetical protein LAWI1_G008856 [Lachnellula willkommii]|uniref:Uncharacterized protein n=1 Tax=Lachnellula willkommii TaxID=215461 RepID=A0A559LZR6_9HELO|nr:hypothetical protein LAWI1_G008856 [Lachnellula willkommii]
MDTKLPIPPSAPFHDAGAAPPSYTESIDTTSYYSTQIRSQLSDLTHQISSLQTQKSLLSHAQDQKILALLTTQIQAYLSDFASSGLKKGTLILVPASGMTDENALPSDCDFKNADEYDSVVRVRSKEDAGRDEWSSGSGDMMYWRDEDMALRLAGALRPPPDPRNMELPPRKEQVVATAEEPRSRGFWGSRKKSVTKTPDPAAVERKVDAKMPSTDEEPRDKVVMDVRAEEVVFRTENELGIYGTERGWGIVLKLRVILVGDQR